MSTLGRDADEIWRRARKGYSTDVTVLPSIAGVLIQQGDQAIYFGRDEAERIAKEIMAIAKGAA